MTDAHTLTLNEAAATLGMPARTVRHLIKEKGLPCVKPSKRLLFSEEEILAWKRAQRPKQKVKAPAVEKTTPLSEAGTDDVDLAADSKKESTACRS